MDENNILQRLIKVINKAEKLKVEYGVTGQEVNRDNNEVITFSSNTTMEVNYREKKGSRLTIRSDFSGTYTTKEIFEKCKKEVVEKDSNEQLEKSFTVSYNDEDYDNLFNSGGKLYPLQLEELIPIDSQMNNKSCQVCYPSSVIIDSIPGYVKSTYVIYEKNKDYYDITMIMRQLDSKTDISLIQYCNTRIYIL